MNQNQTSLSWPRRIWRVSADLFVVILLVVLANVVVFSPTVHEQLFRAVVGIAFVLFAPGYALVSSLFPLAGRSDETTIGRSSVLVPGRGRGDKRIDSVERLALAFAFSIALVPLLVIGLTFTPFTVTLVSTVLSISAVTVLCTGVAAIRRWRLPEGQYFHVSPRQLIATGTGFITDADSRFDAVLNVGIAVAIVFAVGTLSFALVEPPDGERFTDFYVLTENDDGELVATGYPTEFTVGDRKPVILGIHNQEQESTNYTVVVELHRVETKQQGDDTKTSVLAEEELRRFNIRLESNETWKKSYPVEPTMTGENLRLALLLYKGDPPANPTVENAAQELHLWVSVEPR